MLEPQQASPERDQLYKVMREIGRGGMGVVYEAEDLGLERKVALKVLHPHLSGDPAHASRLEREARLAARVEHPNVVRVHHIEWLDGRLAIEMQYVEGVPLHHLLQDKALYPQQVVELLRQLLEALVACHERGVIHCDLKPANLLVTTSGHVYLSDFGVSKAAYDGTAAGQISSQLWGTPWYSPPEAWKGERPTAKWDVYAAGMIAYEALAGASPYVGCSPETVMRRKLDDELPAVQAAPPGESLELCALIQRMVAREPQQRPETAAAALKCLRDLPDYHQGHQTLRLPEVAAPATIRQGTSGQLGGRWRRATIATLLLSSLSLLAYQTMSPRAVPVSPAPPTAPPAAPVAESAIGEMKVVTIGRGEEPTQGFVFFDYDDGIHGRELWYYDPQQQQFSLTADLAPGPVSSNPRNLWARSNSLYFSATTPDYGEELWIVWHPTIATAPTLVKDINPGPVGSAPVPVANSSQLLFYATTMADGRELWVTNGHEGQTGMIRQLAAGADNSALEQPPVIADATGAYLIAMGGEPLRSQLWRYDIHQNDILPLCEVDIETVDFAVTEAGVVLSQPDLTHGRELWVYRSGSDAAELLIDLWPGPESANPTQFATWQGRVLFAAQGPATGNELWVTDGTPGGTTLVLDIFPGKEGSEPYGFVVGTHYVFFRARTPEHGLELWCTDGTPTGTRLVADVHPGPESSTPYNLAPKGGSIYFSADHEAYGEELWMVDLVSNPQELVLVEDVSPKLGSAEPHLLQWFNQRSGVMLVKTPSGGDQLADVQVIQVTPRLPAVPGRQE